MNVCMVSALYLVAVCPLAFCPYTLVYVVNLVLCIKHMVGKLQPAGRMQPAIDLGLHSRPGVCTRNDLKQGKTG